ncbi:MAG: Fur family transcriptional regulator [Peptostreptococcus sp.]|uniref:Fur family transcriptional regulator n=1 Tax=Peptostreptococcus sp. TaxID=1262 RepID=UPI002FC97F41
MSNPSCNCSRDNHRQENNDMLKSAKLKATRKRMLLLNCLRHSDAPLTAEEIYTDLKKEININLSTVYRALNALTESDIIIKQMLSDGNSVFQLNNTNHQHILTCKMCGKVSYVDICPVDSLLNEISDQTGYEITGHNLEFIGICPECSRKLV